MAEMVLVASLAASIAAGGCSMSSEDGVRVMEEYISAAGFLKPAAGTAAAEGSLAARVAARSSEGGFESGLRLLGREVSRMAEIIEAGGTPDSGWVSGVAAVAGSLSLPPEIARSFEGLQAAGGDGAKTAVALSGIAAAISDWLDRCPDPMERFEAILAAGESESPDAALAAYRLFKVDRCSVNRAACLSALRKMGAEQAGRASADGILDPEEVVRIEALRTIRRLRLGECLPAVSATFESTTETVEVRRECAKALAEIGDMGSVPALIDALSEKEDDSIRIQALAALRRITSCDFGLRKPLWKKWLESQSKGGGK